MTIKVIDIDNYNIIKFIYENYPTLTYENKGYDCIPKEKLTIQDIKAINLIEQILNNHIEGFSSFQNFRTRGEDIQIRFQYDWSVDDSYPKNCFIGVGYIMLSTLLNGFKNNLQN